MTNKSKWIATTILGAQLLTGTVRADDTADAIASLKKQIELLNAKVEQLQKDHQAAAIPSAATTASDSKTVAPPKSIPTITAGENGFSLQSADTNFTLRLHGMGQFDWHYYANPNYGAKDTFTIRRMRAIASGTVYKNYDYYVQTDFGSGVTSTATNNSFLQDAYVNIHYWPQFQIQAGKFKPPFSLEWVPADEALWFDERGLPAELSPNRDVGAEIHGDLFNGALTYAAGVFNGVPDGASGDAEVADNNKGAAARFFAVPFKNSRIAALQNFGLGLGATYGYEGGTTTPAFATVGRQKFFSYASGAGTAASPNVSETGSHLRLDPQGYYFWGPAGFYWEYAISTEKFRRDAGGKPSFANFENSGWNVAASWNLTGETNVWGANPKPLHPFSIDGSGLGAWQLTARIGQLSLDKGAFPLYAAKGSAQDATSWSVGLNWYMNRNVKWIFDYEQTTFGFGNGKPTPLTAGAQPEKVFMGRLQFAF